MSGRIESFKSYRSPVTVVGVCVCGKKVNSAVGLYISFLHIL